MTNKLAPIAEFIQHDTNDKPLLNSAGLPILLSMPAVKTAEDIERLIALSKPQAVIEQFAELVSLGEQWQFAHEYIKYLEQLAKAEAHNADLPVISKDEEGNDVRADPMSLPEPPVKPPVKSVEDVLAPYQARLTKLQGIEVKGVKIALTEANQNGLSALKTALDLAKEFGVEDQFFPVNFNAETSSGNQKVSIETEAEFKQLGLAFILARKELFK